MKEVIRKYFEEYSIVESNIRSFNEFIDRRLQLIVDDLNKSIVKEGDVDLRLGRITVGKPTIVEADGSQKLLLPYEARLRKLTYASPVNLEINLSRGSEKEFFNAQICKLPIMVKSKNCNLFGMDREKLIENFEDPADPGGYFILNGNERVLVLVEDLAPNQPFVERDSSGRKALRLFSERGSYRIPMNISESKEGELQISFTRFKNIPLIPLIKSLGLIRDVDIVNLIGKDYDSLIVNLYEHVQLQKEDDAIMFIADRMGIRGLKAEVIERYSARVDSFLLPHIGTSKEHRLAKARTLCKFVKQLLLVLKESRPEDDKDHYMNKRVRLAGELFTDLFRINLSILMRDMQHSLQRLSKKKKIYSAKTIVKSALLSRRIESAIATGNWIGERKGLTQNIQRTNYLDLLSQLQRVVSLLPTEQENFKARTLHPTHYGRLCPIETPEGTSIGLRKNLALLSRVSVPIAIDEEALIQDLKNMGMK
ncbi:MAG: DNA-directed RNA polymerase subunit B'' [Nanoarchaeota archaeon]